MLVVTYPAQHLYSLMHQNLHLFSQVANAERKEDVRSRISTNSPSFLPEAYSYALWQASYIGLSASFKGTSIEHTGTARSTCSHNSVPLTYEHTLIILDQPRNRY